MWAYLMQSNCTWPSNFLENFCRLHVTFQKIEQANRIVKRLYQREKTYLVINIPTPAGLPNTGLAVFPYPNLEKQWDPANQMHPTPTLGIHDEAECQMEDQTPKGCDICN